MSGERVERRLAAVLAADVAGMEVGDEQGSKGNPEDDPGAGQTASQAGDQERAQEVADGRARALHDDRGLHGADCSRGACGRIQKGSRRRTSFAGGSWRSSE